MSLLTATLTATFDEPTGTVDLTATVTDGAMDANHAWTLVRSDALGTAEVRVQAGMGLSGSGATGTYTMVVTDHENALSGLVTYTLRVEDETLHVLYATASVEPVTERSWLTFPILPQYSLELPPVGGLEIEHTPHDTYFAPLDRDAVVPVFGVFGPRAGRMQLLAPDFATAVRIIDAYRRLKTALLRIADPAGASMYHSLSRISVRQFAPRAAEWVITGEYKQLQRPSGSLLGTLGWAYEDTTALGETYSATATRFPTYADRTLGL